MHHILGFTLEATHPRDLARGRIEDSMQAMYVRTINLRSEPGGWHRVVSLDTTTESDELACNPAPEAIPRIQHVISNAPVQLG